ncbi:unnamed protein product, partial [Brenthis ino]
MEPKILENKVSINGEKRNKIHNSKEITRSTIKKHNQNNSDIFGEGQSTAYINKRKIDSANTRDFFGVPKIKTDLKLTKNLRTDIHKPLKYYSTPNPARKKENNEKIPVSSYEEYPSEVLQKTTNFETHGCDTFSLATGIDSETRDDLSSTIEHIDENFPADDDTDWSIIQSSQDNTDAWKSSKTSNNTEFWRSNTYDKKETQHLKCPDKCSYHDYYYHYCWRKEVVKRDFSEQSLWDCQSTKSTRSNKSGMKHANIGPSMFTFPQNTSMMTSRNSKRVTQSKAISCAHCAIVDETKSKEVKNISYQALKERDSYLKEGNLNKSISKSSLAIPVYVQENYTEVTPLVVENKVTSTLIHNIDKPMTITCNNAETETVPPDKNSLNSVKVMTSAEIHKEFYNKEIQVLPAHLLTKMSIGMSVPYQLISDVKSSVVTGTKVTSVSSDNIQPSSIQASTLTRISKVATANTGISAIDLLERSSVNGGSHITQCSCNTGSCPDCHSTCVNAVTELNSKSTETSQNFDAQENSNKQIKTDCFVQYSNFSKDSTKHLARIGRSRLLSVRTFMNSEVGTQKSACFTNSKGTNDVKQMSQNFMKPNELLANEPNFVISSNLNAAKWIKGYVKEDEKDIQSIIDISETTVNESLERASLAIMHSKHETREEIKKKSTIKANQQPAVNCVTEKLLGVMPSTSVTEIHLIKDHKEILCTTSALAQDVRSNFDTITSNGKEFKVSKENITSDGPTKDYSQLYEKSVISNKPEILMADKITSGVNYTEEREYKSNFALTSRHILPSIIPCGELCSFKNTEKGDERRGARGDEKRGEGKTGEIDKRSRKAEIC